MSEEAVAQLNEFITAKFLDERVSTNVDIAQVVAALGDSPLWRARAQVVQHVLAPPSSTAGSGSGGAERDVLAAYARLTESDSDNADLHIEAARAAAVFAATDELRQYLARAGALLGFDPELTGVEVRFSPHQPRAVKRLVCLCAPDENATADDENADAAPNPFENVAVASDDPDRYAAPRFEDAACGARATAPLPRTWQLLLLLHSNLTEQHNPSATTTVVSEQALPYVRRLTDVAAFERLDYLAAKHALYHRSLLEQKDVSELERGTVQLLKLSALLRARAATPEERRSALRSFHCVLPLPLRTLHAAAARRLVAASDFANAAPIYEHLALPTDAAVCYAAIGQSERAQTLLALPQLRNDPQALLLRGDLCDDAEALARAWTEFRVPKAKLRLAQRALAQRDLPGALRHAEELLEGNPGDAAALRLAAAAALAQEDWARSAVYLRRHLARDDGDARGWADLATALVQSGQPAPAHHALQQALRVDRNSTPDFGTLTNFAALSAQLQRWDDVLFAFERLAQAATPENTASTYIARLGPMLPRLVEALISAAEYTGSGPQKRLRKLLAEDLVATAIHRDDAVLCRLDGRVRLWAGDYAGGLAQLQRAFNNADEQRLKLYATEYSAALEKYGDKEGRIEGSKAFPGWRAEVERVRARTSST